MIVIRKKMLGTFILLTSLFLSSFAQAQQAISENSAKLHKNAVGKEENNNAVKNLLINESGNSAYAQRLKYETKLINNKFNLLAYRANYLLPFYYTRSPYHQIYDSRITSGQAISNSEVKFQLSFQIPIWENINASKINLRIAYTQVSFWQVYNIKSPFFRETNYEPAIFLMWPMRNWFTLSAGAVHESNGRGGEMERTWNRLYLESVFSVGSWMLDVQPWMTFWKETRSNQLYNPDILRYMGYGKTTVAYKLCDNVISVMLRNQLESGFRRGAVMITWSHPLNQYIKAYVEFFSGYGQSLIEYNHYTNALGIGIAISDWM